MMPKANRQIDPLRIAIAPSQKNCTSVRASSFWIGMPMTANIRHTANNRVKAVVESVTARAEEADEKATEGSAPDVSLSLKITDMAASRSGGDAASMLYGG